jgi:transcription initiation factor TFIIIB Brf1 subunit/transcription initiation factor TFIIB
MKEIQRLNLPPEIKFRSEEIYKQYFNKKVHRKSCRTAILFACLYQSYKEMKEVKEPQYIGEIIGANQKEMRKGMKFYYMNRPELDYVINAIDLIPHVLEKSKTFISDTSEIENLFHYIKERSEMISRSNPYSVACSLVYYVLVKNNKITNKESFCEQVGRCPMTIMKIFKEIEILIE